MASSFRTLLTIFAVMLVAVLMTSSSAMAKDDNWMPMKPPACTGSIAECMADGEFDMDTEINRRILATSNYISYDALKRDSIPCSQRGASYYNCQQGAEANPYNRGCSIITRCRS